MGNKSKRMQKNVLAEPGHQSNIEGLLRNALEDQELSSKSKNC